MEFRSEFWCSRNCSSTMRAFPRSSTSCDRIFSSHGRSASEVVRYFFCAFSHIFHKNTHPSMTKSVGDFISTQRNSLRTLCVILEGFAHIFFCKLLSDGSKHIGYDKLY
jgi:hypothetical protein